MACIKKEMLCVYEDVKRPSILYLLEKSTVQWRSYRFIHDA
jgi:hypothetical protein